MSHGSFPSLSEVFSSSSQRIHLLLQSSVRTVEQILITLRLATVSYTHLDVYKRQVI